MHYKRWKRWGDPEERRSAPRGDVSLASRESRIDRSGTCWIWVGAKANGYGMFRVDGVTYLAHRRAWEEANGRPVPSGLVVCHSCDNPPCVNPEHLWVGTPLDNNTDKVQKGRHRGWNKEPRTHCHQGHDFTPENTFVGKDGFRRCRICQRVKNKRYRERRKANGSS